MLGDDKFKGKSANPTVIIITAAHRSPIKLQAPHVLDIMATDDSVLR